MSRISRETCRLFRSMESDLGNLALKWPVSPTSGTGGAAYPCVPSQSLLGKMLVAGGESPTGSDGFFIRSQLFRAGNFPTSQQCLLFNGQIYRITMTTTSADQAYVFLDCVVKDKNA